MDIRFHKLNDFVRFHEVCDATNVKVMISMGIRDKTDDNIDDGTIEYGEIDAETRIALDENSSPSEGDAAGREM